MGFWARARRATAAIVAAVRHVVNPSAPAPSVGPAPIPPADDGFFGLPSGVSREFDILSGRIDDIQPAAKSDAQEAKRQAEEQAKERAKKQAKEHAEKLAKEQEARKRAEEQAKEQARKHKEELKRAKERGGRPGDDGDTPGMVRVVRGGLLSVMSLAMDRAREHGHDRVSVLGWSHVERGAPGKKGYRAGAKGGEQGVWVDLGFDEESTVAGMRDKAVFLGYTNPDKGVFRLVVEPRDAIGRTT